MTVSSCRNHTKCSTRQLVAESLTKQLKEKLPTSVHFPLTRHMAAACACLTPTPRAPTRLQCDPWRGASEQTAATFSLGERFSAVRRWILRSFGRHSHRSVPAVHALCRQIQGSSHPPSRTAAGPLPSTATRRGQRGTKAGAGATAWAAWCPAMPRLSDQPGGGCNTDPRKTRHGKR